MRGPIRWPGRDWHMGWNITSSGGRSTETAFIFHLPFVAAKTASAAAVLDTVSARLVRICNACAAPAFFPFAWLQEQS